MILILIAIRIISSNEVNTYSNSDSNIDNINRNNTNTNTIAKTNPDTNGSCVKLFYLLLKVI